MDLRESLTIRPLSALAQNTKLLQRRHSGPQTRGLQLMDGAICNNKANENLNCSLSPLNSVLATLILNITLSILCLPTLDAINNT